jgi:hypothetical protein
MAGEAMNGWRQVRLQVTMYLRYVGLLLLPGWPAPTYNADQIKPGDLEGWSADDLKLLITEGQRQYDRTVAQLAEIRGRAQNLLAIGIALIGILAGTRPHASCRFGWYVWMASVLLTGLSVLGAAAILAVRADMDTIHAAVLSQRSPGVLRSLAEDYAGIQASGMSTSATRLTLLWDAVLLILVGGTLGLIAFLINH